MFKSKLSRHISLQQDNCNQDYTCKVESSNLFDSNRPIPYKSSVKFDSQTISKENQSENYPNSSTYKRRDKSCKSWAKKSDSSDRDQEKYKFSNLSVLKQQNCYNKSNQYNSKTYLNDKLFASSYHRPKQNHYDKPNYDVKFRVQQLCIQKMKRSSKQRKSMKTLPLNLQEDQNQTHNSKKRLKFEAYKSLLKTSQQLMTKYNRIQQEKDKLKNDLKQQKQEHAKSSKRICFMQDEQKQCKSHKQIKICGKVNEPRSQSKYDRTQEYNKYEETSASPTNKKYQNSLYQKVTTKKPENYLSKTFTFSKKLLSSPENKQQKSSINYFTSGGFNLNNKQDKKICLNDFQLGKSLGQGAFGQVFPAKHKKTNMLVAIKKVKKQKVKHMLDQFLQQIKIQMFLDHPNIVKLYGFFDDCLHFYIIMEYMEGGSLYAYLKKNKALSLQEVSLRMRQVCQGLKNMHDNSILHRDIKPQNIVITNDVCKLCDFGWSAVCKDRRTTYCGTLDYVSPQIIQGQGYDDCVDIWCIGVLTYELLVGKTPFYNISRKQTMKKIMDCSLQYPQNLPQVAVSFIKRILKKNPDDRTDIGKILQDPFMKLGNQKNHFQ